MPQPTEITQENDQEEIVVTADTPDEDGVAPASDGEDVASPQDDDFGGATDADVAFARRNGWAEKSKWRGNPDRWQNAKDFAEHSRGINTMLKAELSDRDAKHERELAQLRKDVSEWQRLETRRIESEFAQREANLRAQRATAVANADAGAFEEADRALDQLRADRVKAAPVPAQQPAAAPEDRVPPEDRPALASFIERNPYMKEGGRKANLAYAVSADIKNERPDLIGPGRLAAFFQELESRLQRDYPEDFGGAPRMPRARVESGAPARQRTTSRTKGFNDMPEEARKTAQNLKQRGFIKDVNDYAKSYWIEQGETA